MHWETKYFVTCFITTFALLKWSGLNLLYLCGFPVLLNTLGILAPTQISKMLEGQIFNSYLNECACSADSSSRQGFKRKLSKNLQEVIGLTFLKKENKTKRFLKFPKSRMFKEN